MAAKEKNRGRKGNRSRGRRKKGRGRHSSFPWLRLLLFFVLLAAVSLSALAVYFYQRFDRMIEVRLNLRPPHETAVFSGPYRLNSGQPMNRQLLAETMRRLGYQPANGGEAEDRFTSDRHGFTIHQMRQGRAEQLFVLCCAQGRVTGLRRNGSAVDHVLLKGEFLSNLYGSSREKKKNIRFQELPEHLVQAVLAAEDADFFTHSGIDWISVARAVLVNLIRRSPAQGASTLTQQFVKNFFLTSEKSLTRKFEELVLAWMLERRFSKQRIFELYANEVYQGQLGSFAIVGLGQSAQVYFGKEVRDLSLGESALLAGIIQAPNRFSPVRHSEPARHRRNLVLDLMEKNGFIGTRENALARMEPIRILPSSHRNYRQAPYFVDYVREVLARQAVDWSRAETQVFTTLDPQLQKAAFLAVQNGLSEIDKRLKRRGRSTPVAQAALLAADPRSGAVLAMVGGRNYAESQFNRATQALRQPGSTFKPFVYAAALEESRKTPHPLTLATLVMDEPVTFQFDEQSYSPSNFGDRYYGPVTIRQALARSLNIPTVKMAHQTGYATVAARSRRAGFSHNLQPFPSLALGAFEVSLLELTQGYTAFANQGTAIQLYAISKWQSGAEAHHSIEPALMPFVDARTAFLITSALQSAIDEGTGRAVRRLGFGPPAAGKTGSSNDSWFVGYTPELLCAVWVGFDDSSSLGLEGSEAALPIWTEFMNEAQRYAYLSGEDFPVPEGVVSVEIDPMTGLLASASCPESRTEYFIEGTEPERFCEGDSQRRLMTQQLATGEELQAPPADRTKKGKSFWGWFKKILP